VNGRVTAKQLQPGEPHVPLVEGGQGRTGQAVVNAGCAWAMCVGFSLIGLIALMTNR